MDDTESTPRTGRKHPTDPDMPSGDLLKYQLREVRDTLRDLKSIQAEQGRSLARIETQLAVGQTRLAEHDASIGEIRRTNHKAMAGLISAGGLVLWELVKIFLPNQPPK